LRPICSGTLLLVRWSVKNTGSLWYRVTPALRCGIKMTNSLAELLILRLESGQSSFRGPRKKSLPQMLDDIIWEERTSVFRALAYKRSPARISCSSSMSAFRCRIGTRATVNCRAGIHSDPLTFLRRQKAQALGALRRLDGEFPSVVILGQKSVTRMSVGCGNWRSLNERPAAALYISAASLLPFPAFAPWLDEP
jgi:hypothetical protein